MFMPPTFARDFRRTLLWILRITFPAYLYGAVTLSSLGVPPEFELIETTCHRPRLKLYMPPLARCARPPKYL